MEQWFSGFRVKVLILRLVLGVLFAFLLARLFFPAGGLLKILGLAGALTFAAYVLEYLRGRGGP